MAATDARWLRGVALVVAILTSLAGHAAAEDAPPPPAPPVASAASDASTGPDVHAGSEVAAYGDTDHVYVLSPSISGRVSEPTEGWSVDARYLVDVVSAASVDIVSTASRRWEEVRHAGTLTGAYKPDTFGVTATADLSVEPDYVALTAGGAVSQDFASKNGTFLFGYSHEHDIAGRSSTPFSVFARVIDSESLKSGVTLLASRSTIVSFIGDATFERGDSSKPYRYVPLFAPGTNVPRGASIDLVTQLRLSARALEQLPLSRQRYAASTRIAHRFGSSATWRADERLYADSWQMLATTTDTRFLLDLGKRVEIGPHLRFHAQSAVGFWQRAYELRAGYDFPALRTGDRELGPLVNGTFGGSTRVGIGRSADPRSWVLGLDANVTSTHYLDDIYITQRLSGIAALSLEVDL